VAGSLEISPRFQSAFEPSSDPLDQLTAGAVLGVHAFSRGDFRAAHRYLEPAVALVDLDNVGTQHLQLLQRNGFDAVLNTLLFLAWTEFIEGNVVACRAHISKALDAAEHSGHPYLIATSLSVVGSIAHHLRDAATAQAHGQRLMGLAQENHFLYWMGGALCMLGWASCAADQVQEGLGVIQQGIALFQAMGDAYVLPYFLSYVAEAQLREKRFVEANDTIDKVLGLAEGRGTRAFVADFERLKGEALLGLGDARAAEDRFRLACAISRVQGANLFGLRAALSLARLLAEQGRHQEIAALLRPALSALTSPADLPETAQAEELLRSANGRS
jgi:predicted ATPase